MSPIRPRTLLIVFVALAAAACGEPAPTGSADAGPTAPLQQITQQRVSDLVAINDAIQRYAAIHHEYPPSDNWHGYASPAGPSLGADWISGLDLPALPRDPAQSDDPNGPQYLYVSSRNDYKLIANQTGDCSRAVEVQGVRIDPARSGGAAGPCTAYGFWSDGLRDY